MRSQILWGVALTAVGIAIALIAVFGLPFLLIYGVPLIVIGIALIVWQGREEIIEEIGE